MLLSSRAPPPHWVTQFATSGTGCGVHTDTVPRLTTTVNRTTVNSVYLTDCRLTNLSQHATQTSEGKWDFWSLFTRQNVSFWSFSVREQNKRTTETETTKTKLNETFLMNIPKINFLKSANYGDLFMLRSHFGGLPDVFSVWDLFSSKEKPLIRVI